MRLSLSLLLLLIIPEALYAQQFPVQRLTVEEGLGHSIVYRTTQSTDGYIWFSTDNGLTRYDGTAFRNFTTADGLPSNFIFDVVEWKGELFVCTLGGGIIKYGDDGFVPAYDTSYQVPMHPVELRMSEKVVTVVDRFKALHILTGDRFEKITHEHLGIDPMDELLVFNAEILGDVVFASTSKGLYIYSNGHFNRIPLQLPLHEPFISRTYPVDSNTLFIVIEKHLLEYDLRTHQHRILIKDEFFSRFTRIITDKEGNIWVSNVDGNLFFLRRTPDEQPALHVLEEIVINDLFEDRENNLWLSTYGEGVWLIPSTRVRNVPIKGDILSDLAIDPATNNILVATLNSGMRVYHQDFGRFLTEAKDNAIKSKFNDDRFLGPAVNPGDGSLLLASGHTLFRVSRSRVDSMTVPNPITSIYYQKSTNRIWVGGRHLLGYCSSGINEFKNIATGEFHVTRAITEMTDGRIVLGTDAGLFIEDKQDTFRSIAADASLRNADVNTLFFDHFRNTLWAGTNNGLAVLTRDSLRLVNNPITHVRCNDITQDESGNLYIGSVKGLIFFDGASYEILTTREGLSQSNIIKVNYQPEKQLLTLLAPNSISTIDAPFLPSLVQFEVPDILIEQISSPDETLRHRPGRIRFNSRVKQLNIKLSTPQIRNRDKVRYSYRVNDKEWTSFSGNEITLHSLPVGEMTLSIKVYKMDHEDDAKVLNLSLYTPPPFYYKWWFIAILVVIFLLLLALVVTSYSRNKNEMLLQENKRLDLEHKALRNLLNPHFLYNAINSIHAFILQNDQKQTLGYLSKFSQLVRLNLELLSTDHASLDKEIKNIRLYLEFEKLRFADKLNYKIDIDPRLVQSEVTVPSFIIQPFVENAIWHGLLPRKEGGKLEIRVNLDSNAIMVVIDDNGIGINESLKHPKAEIDKKPSMGIKVLLERFDLLRKVNPHYHITIEDKADSPDHTKESGTRVTIAIPL